MRTRPNRNDPWHGPNSAFQPNEGPVASDDFAPLALTGSSALRDFIQRETHASIVDNRSSETLGKGVYLRRLPDSSYELLIYKGRSSYDGYYSDDREKLLEIAAEKMGTNNA